MCECNGLKCSLSTRLGSGKKKGVLHYRLRISGDLSIIPTKIERKKGIKVNSYRSKKCWNDYTFKVEPYGIDEYYGFTVDSNHLFVLGDLTITHNTFPRLIDLYNVMLPSV
jgi:replicative DNA helicase